jgi:hypothetical protein
MNVIELIQESNGITKKITDLRWSFGYGPSKYWQIFDIIANLSVPTLSARSRKQITHLITIHKEYIILAILSKIAGKQEYADIYTGDIEQSIKKMKELGIDWHDLDIIQKSLDADYQRRLNISESITGDIRMLKDALDASNYFRIFRLLSNLNIEAQSERGINNINRILTSHKETLIRNILLSMAGDTVMINRKDLLLSIPKLKQLGITWPELDIIQNGMTHELNKSKINEETVNNDNYGGWIDSKNKRIYYVDEYKHNAQALRLGADPMAPEKWMFNRGFVRFVTRYSPDNTLSLNGRLSDIKATYQMWWPQARKCEAVYVDTSDTNLHTAFKIRSNPDDRRQAQQLFGPQAQLSEEI